MSLVFQVLSSTYPTWSALKTFLTGEEGGYLRVDDNSTPEQPFALIRYVKGKSNMALPHVGFFRSVVWDVIKNLPVSVAPFKSEEGEGLPTTGDPTVGFRIERFIDGVMICGFYDNYNNLWRFHTRSTLNANCRFYSQTKSFRQMFEEAVTQNNTTWLAFLDGLDKTVNYTWVLQHPENRIVVAVPTPRIYCVQKWMIQEHGIPIRRTDTSMYDVQAVTITTWGDLLLKTVSENAQFKHNFQGFVVKNLVNNGRWKIRGEAYNRVRKLRGNSARRDFLWLSLWRSGTLRDYLTLYPEERNSANAIVEKWKQITNTVYHIYADVFKVHSMQKAAIPPKFRPFVFGLHNLYINELKSQSRSVDWKTALQYMNSRDTAQALYAINWEVRQQSQVAIPLESQVDAAVPAVETAPVDASAPPPQEPVPRAAEVTIVEVQPVNSVA
jgi:hypothetical protein